MPSTYTLNNGIELIATGEQSGTWGDTTNTNFSLIDTALDGQVTVTLASAGTSGSPNTLPISDGASSNGRNRMVIFNDGADLGATAYVQLTPNDAEKIVYVRNALSGSRSIILFQGTYSASNDYEIPAGTTAVIYFNGGGSGAVAANVFNNAYFDSLRLGGVSVTAILDDDSMATASATTLATSESIKAYVDAQVGANNELSEVLANGNTTGGTDIVVSSGDQITTNTISETTAAAGVTVDGVLLKDGGATFTADAVFGDNDKAIFGAGSDLQIYHDGSNSVIHDSGTGDLTIRGTNLKLQPAAGTEDFLTATTNAEVTIYHNNNPKLATTSTGIDVTGSISADGLTVDGAATNGVLIKAADNAETTYPLVIQNSADSLDLGLGAYGFDNTIGVSQGSDFKMNVGRDIYMKSDGKNYFRMGTDGDISFYEDTGTTAQMVWDASAEALTFGDNVKATFGAGSDLQIYHDGSNSIIRDAGVGDMQLWVNDLKIYNAAGTTPLFTLFDTGATNLGYAGAFKLATTSTGVDVTGTVTADGLTVDGVVKVGFTTAPTWDTNSYLYSESGYGLHVEGYNQKFSTGSSRTNRMEINQGGDISFYEGTGTTPKFFWDASAERLGIGTSSPVKPLEVSGSVLSRLSAADYSFGALTSGGGGFFIEPDDYTLSNPTWTLRTFANEDLAFQTGISERMRIDSSGNVGIGTSSPSEQLSVAANISATDLYVTSGGDTSANGISGGLKHGGVNSKTIIIEADPNNVGANTAMIFKVDATERMRIDSTGNVGIGTSSPAAALQVSASDDTYLFIKSDGAGDYSLSLGSGGTPLIARGSGAPLAFGTVTNNTPVTGWAEQVRIDSSGNLGVGTTAPTSKIMANASQSSGVADLLTLRDASAGTTFNFQTYSDPSYGTSNRFDFSGGYLAFRRSGTEAMRIDSSGRLLVGTTDTALYNNTSGNGFIYDAVTGSTQMTRDNASVLYINRSTSDGGLVEFFQNGTSEGSISVSGTTVSYNGGNLSRWSRLPDGTDDTNIFKGTVMTNLNEMIVWDGEDNEQLNYTNVSSVEGDVNVAGIFVAWDESDDWGDYYLAQTGDLIIRIAAGVAVNRGDLLMSAGDGTAKPQGDDIVRSKTIAKVTSTEVTYTYADGSYCVPCVVMGC